MLDSFPFFPECGDVPLLVSFSYINTNGEPLPSHILAIFKVLINDSNHIVQCSGSTQLLCSASAFALFGGSALGSRVLALGSSVIKVLSYSLPPSQSANGWCHSQHMPPAAKVLRVDLSRMFSFLRAGAPPCPLLVERTV